MKDNFLIEHQRLTRRYFLRLGAVGAATMGLWPMSRARGESTGNIAPADGARPEGASADGARPEGLEPYFTPQEKFRDVSRGKPLPHSLPDDKKREVGLTRETWKLEVVSDPDHPASIRNPLTKKDGTALDFPGLLKLAEKHAVRFAKAMTCLNIGCPLGTGIWEGVPLRELVWLTQPRENLRRIFYHGYHNDDPQQMFRSSLPIDRVLEDPFDLPPVILCYKLNGQWLDSERGGPVRIVVPEAYGFKSIKWLTRIVLTNLFHANDTYADGNNDVDSALKTFAATLSVPSKVKPNQPIPITGYAQVGISGLSKVQVWIQSNATQRPPGDRYFATAPWTDAQILPPPKHWGALADEKILKDTFGFDPATGQPLTWPMRLTRSHWATLLPGLPAGGYTLRSRTIDAKGVAQPLPRPFQKSGHSAIESVDISVKA
ncbi:MAG TPA: molybdopterin-dependent oxidoreductase [Candidatus Binatia bacterium]|nr:molybdopterin-dependent oxidoreductase [Candidatus Binatia bacterium]